jgi:hypothetical protein
VAGGAWQPDSATLQPLQEGIEAFVQSRAQATSRSLPDRASYTFQYQGQMAGDRRYLYVSALCAAESDLDLHQRFVLVTDGGSCYLAVKFDPVIGRSCDLAINNEG